MVGVDVEVVAALAVERSCKIVATVEVVLGRRVVAFVLFLVCGVEGTVVSGAYVDR